MDVGLRNGVGRAFASECGISELWMDTGPEVALREAVQRRTLAPEQLVLMRFALDFYDGTGGLSLAEGINELTESQSADALFFLAEFLGSGMTALPKSLAVWISQYNFDPARVGGEDGGVEVASGESPAPQLQIGSTSFAT